MNSNLLLTENDIYGSVICFFFALFLLKWVSVKWIKNKLLFNLFLIGFLLRVIGVMASAYFNLYIVKSDSTIYFSAAKAISNALSNLDFSESVKIFYTDFSDLPFKTKCFFSNTEAFNWVYNDNKALIHIASIISYFTFDSYLAISFFLSLWGYMGTWLIYHTLSKKFPDTSVLLYVFIIAYPSLFFWTTGLMKEPVCMGAIGLLFFLLFNRFNFGKRNLFFYFLSFISLFLLFKIKLYLFYCFFLSVILAFVFYYANKIYKDQNIVVAISFWSFTVLVFLSIFYFLGNIILKSVFEDVTQNLINITKAQLEQGGSSYDIGQPDLNAVSMIKYVLSSINVTLFRPFIWESSKPQLWFSALEGLFSLLMIGYLIFKKSIKKTMTFIVSNPSLLFSIIFTIILSAIIGGISFNFGTLIRYKIPLLPFFFAFLLVVFKNKSIDRKLKMVKP